MRTPLALLALVCGLAAALPTAAMVRPGSYVRRAIHYSAPGLSYKTTQLYASLLVEEGRARGFDPLTVISIVHFESGWNPGLVNNNPPREYSVGLGQVNVIHSKSCRDGALQSPACSAYVARLKDGTYNLRIVSALITVNRKVCRDKTKQPALFARWLSSYQGYNRPGRGVWCNMKRNSEGVWHDLKTPEKAARVMRYRRQLIRKLAH